MQWYTSEDPSENDELVERGTACWRQDHRWEGFTPLADEEVVVIGEPIGAEEEEDEEEEEPTEITPLPIPPATPPNETAPESTPSSTSRQEPEFVAPNKETRDILACIRSRSPGDEVFTSIANTRISFLYGKLGGDSALTTPVKELPGFEDEPTSHYAIAFDRHRIADRADRQDASYYEFFAGVLLEELHHVRKYVEGKTTAQQRRDEATIRKEAWKNFKRIFGSAAPQLPTYDPLEQPFIASCLRNKGKP